MRVGVWRLVACVSVMAVAVAASAQPMPTPAAPDAKDTSAKRAELQAELLAILKRMSANPTPMPTPVTPVTTPPTDGKTDVPAGAAPDRVRAAMNQFRDNQLEAARDAFNQMPTEGLGKEDKAFVRYMLATCHRRLGNIARAEAIYREVANSGDDEFVAGYASQQLYLISSEKELQGQLEQLRSRAKSK